MAENRLLGWVPPHPRAPQKNQLFAHTLAPPPPATRPVDAAPAAPLRAKVADVLRREIRSPADVLPQLRAAEYAVAEWARLAGKKDVTHKDLMAAVSKGLNKGHGDRRKMLAVLTSAPEGGEALRAWIAQHYEAALHVAAQLAIIARRAGLQVPAVGV